MTESIRRFEPVVRLAILDIDEWNPTFSPTLHRVCGRVVVTRFVRDGDFIPGNHQVQPHYGVRPALFKLIFTSIGSVGTL